jgi:hypothetical protein
MPERVRQAICYVGRGQAIVARDPLAYGLAVVVYALPSLITAYIVATVASPTLLQHVLVFCLPWLTLVMGSLVIMMLVGTHAKGRTISAWKATVEGARWAPRYLWTNAHTTCIFWVPMGILHGLQGWQETAFPGTGTGALLAAAAWWLVIGVTAVAIHVRTLLAPFLAVHGGLPGTVAVIEAWRLSGRNFWLSLATFLAGVLPVGVPLILAGGGLMLLLTESARAAIWHAQADLIWVGIHAVRPVLIPAVYLLYKETWHAELDRRAVEGEAPLPGFARALLAITRPLPAPGRWS